MDVLKFSTRAAIFVAVAVLYILYSPNLLDFEPSGFQKCYVDFEGALSFNKDLDKSELIAKGEVPQPECLEYNDGRFYTSLGDGRIVMLVNDKVIGTFVNVSEATKKVSRPLGLRFFKGNMYVADALAGLLKVDIKTGAVSFLLSVGDSIRGIKILFPDDLDIDDQGIIYFSDLSAKWDYHRVMHGVAERSNDGRVISYDTKTGKSDVLVDKLYGANGIQLTYDKKALLIAETFGRRILKYHLDGPRKGMKDLFSLLPGEPDNIRTSSRGGYWVALPFSSSAKDPHPIDLWTSNYKIGKTFIRFCHLAASGFSFIYRFVPMPILQYWEDQLKSGRFLLNMLNIERPTIIELDTEGNIIRSLQSDDPKYSLMTHAHEKDGYLYLGSFAYDYIVKVKL